ncbi:hypothetical protein B0J11DRAFT_447464 [Dendryphion nanum]|uniref:BTB domain-containing protein n=1 Tax=Dendryphion nanum TaxID=256645 RepID=A0A9P9D330_9PLEO|nr:hypothetical protein B0J11DRAFT_447464 [Dendryphion nanum]
MTIENSNRLSTLITEAASNGDVVLVVGTGEKRVRVCSGVLKIASKYFTALLGPHFNEGHDIGGNEPKEVMMPYDNAKALEIICNVIHLRNDVVPKSLDSADILDIAITADKFDCIVALKHVSTIWLNPKEKETVMGLGNLMAAAYILNDPQAFSDITRAMIFHHKDSYLLLTDSDVVLVDILPWKVFGKYYCAIFLLEERRSQLRTELLQIILKGATDAGTDDNGNCKCAWSSRHSLVYLDLLRIQEINPSQILNTTISHVITRLEQMNDPVVSGTQCSYRWHSTPSYRSQRSWRLETFMKSNGLCIDCLRFGTTAVEQNCRIKH